MDFLIKNGQVYDPETHQLIRKNMALVNGKIEYPGEGRDESGYRQVIDARDCLVTPGLIDYHTHYFFRGSENGVNGDAASFCMGITTAVDGGTAGVGGYELYRASVMAMSSVRILNCLLVASGGQSNDRYPENLDPRYFEEEKILDFFRRYGDNLVGLKTRLSRGILDEDMARSSLKRTVEIAEKAGTRVVVHVTDCPLPLDEVAEILRPGDVICHIYQNRGEHTCLDERGKVLPGLWEARKRGVLFDASNGRSNFDLEVARKAVEQGFVPDVISSDNNASSCFLQPLHSLPRILSKYLEFGMPLEQVLDCATWKPAQLIGRPELGTLAEGSPADVALFRLKKKDVEYSDINSNTMTGHQVLVPQMTFKGGQCVYCQADFG